MPGEQGNFSGSAPVRGGHIGPLCSLCDGEPHDAVYDSDGVEIQAKTYGYRLMGNGTCVECLPSKKKMAWIGVGVICSLGVFAFLMSAFIGKKMYAYLSIKNDNGESNWYAAPITHVRVRFRA